MWQTVLNWWTLATYPRQALDDAHDLLARHHFDYPRAIALATVNEHERHGWYRRRLLTLQYRWWCDRNRTTWAQWVKARDEWRRARHGTV